MLFLHLIIWVFLGFSSFVACRHWNDDVFFLVRTYALTKRLKCA